MSSEVKIEEVALLPQAEVKVELSLTSRVNITDFTAQRKVSKLLLDQVGNLLYGEHPDLIAGKRLLWRVPVWLGLPTVGPAGQVGTLDVDALSGEILFTQAIIDDVREHGNVMAKRTSSTKS